MQIGRGKSGKCGVMSFQKLLLKHKGKVCILFLLIGVAAAANIYAGYKLSLWYDVISSPNMKTAITYTIHLIMLWVISSGMAYFSHWYEAVFLETIHNDLKGEMINTISEMDCETFENKEPGEYASWLTNDMNQIEAKCMIPFFNACESFCTVLFCIAALKSMHVYILLACAVSSVILYFVPKFFEKGIEKSTKAISNAGERFSQKIYDTISGFLAFVTTNHRDIFKKQNKQSSESLEHEKKILTQKIAKMDALSTIIFRILENMISGLTAVMVFLDMVGLGALFAIGNLGNRFLNGIHVFFANIVLLRSSSRLFEKFELPIVAESKKDCLGIKDQIKVENLSITYGKNQIMKNGNFLFECHKKYAIIGESGCGKSSLVKSIVGLHSHDSGKIYFDGIDKEEYSKSSVFNQIAYISQDPYIFNDSIRFNLTFGKSGFTEEEIRDVIRSVNLEEFVKNQPQNMDTVLNDNGRNISGGEKQRLAIARALLLKRKIWIIDEGTSALDEENVKRIEKLLLENSDYTVILITHHMRKEAEKYFDAVYCLNM